MEKQNEKIKLIDCYIKEINEIVNSSDIEEARKMQKKIVGVFRGEINDITRELSNYSMQGLYDDNYKPDFIYDLSILKAKLENYRANLCSGYVNNNRDTIRNEVNIHNNVDISIADAVNVINKLPENVISKEDKETIEEKLSSIERLLRDSDKDGVKKKLFGLVKWLADKSIDVAIAVLPLIGTISSKLSGF